MRPKSVIHAERLYLLSIGFILAGAVVQWAPLVELYGVAFAAGVTAFAVGLFLLLVLLTTRRGSNGARWTLVVLTALGAGLFLLDVSSGEVMAGWPGVIATLQVVLSVVGAVLLFRPAAATWFARAHDEWEEDK